MHDGTVRDLCFLNDSCSGKVLVSGGAGDCKLYVSDCGVLTPLQAYGGHSGHIFSVYSWENNMVVTGSQVPIYIIKYDKYLLVSDVIFHLG